jgi:hypothetical protein
MSYLYWLLGLEEEQEDHSWDEMQRQLKYEVDELIKNKFFKLNHRCWNECYCYHNQIYKKKNIDVL